MHTLYTYIQRYEVTKSYKNLKLTGTRRIAAISGQRHQGSLLTDDIAEMVASSSVDSS